MKNAKRSAVQNAESLFNEADKLEEKGDFKGAFKVYSTIAASGSSWGQVNLGNYYADGRGTKKNLERAAYWYKKAYRNGNSTGARNFAIDKKKQGDIRSAVRWFKRAAAMNDGSACIELAKIYNSQRGKREMAVSLLEKVLRMSRDNASDLNKEQAESLLQQIHRGQARRVPKRRH